MWKRRIEWVWCGVVGGIVWYLALDGLVLPEQQVVLLLHLLTHKDTAMKSHRGVSEGRRQREARGPGSRGVDLGLSVLSLFLD
jgi:hypothetical protein